MDNQGRRRLESDMTTDLAQPVIIKDEKYTVTPTKDERILSQCILELAQATRDALDLDFNQNRRYCRRLRLDRLNQHGQRQQLLVLLPYEAYCWNSFCVEDIVILMLEAIKEVDYQNIAWSQLRALLDDFMDPLVYRFIEVLEKSESAEDVDFAKVERRFLRAQQNSPPAPSTRQVETKSINLTVHQDDDDDDDDCIIIE